MSSQSLLGVFRQPRIKSLQSWSDQNCSTADDILFFFLYFFRVNKTGHFMWIVCQADNSNEMSFLWKKKKKKKKNWKCCLLRICLALYRLRYIISLKHWMLGKNFRRWHFEIFFLFFLENRIWDHHHGFDWLCWGLTTRQPLRVILCRLPEKGRKEIEERVEEMKERDREERGTGMKVKKQKK